MRRRPGAARVTRMAKTARTVTHEATLWTDFVVAGERVYIRTRRPVPLLDELRESAVAEGAEPPEIELRPVAPEAEP
jgi:hypothetical protein